jgi:hypothetical protein
MTHVSKSYLPRSSDNLTVVNFALLPLRADQAAMTATLHQSAPSQLEMLLLKEYQQSPTLPSQDHGTIPESLIQLSTLLAKRAQLNTFAGVVHRVLRIPFHTKTRDAMTVPI